MSEATIVIVTRNRRAVAERAVRSALAQDADVEVLVVDDASEDGTADHLAAMFPAIEIRREIQRRGYILQRNLGASLARGPLIVSIDDDALFTSPDTVRQIIEAFRLPRVGAVSMPHVDVVDGVAASHFAIAPDDDDVWIVPTFIGTAYAVRRELFLQLGGFEGRLFHWAEEEEYCRRMLGAGFVCRAIRTPPIEHHPHPAGRHQPERNRYIWRNRILVPWTTVPMPRLLGRLAYNTLGTLYQSRHSIAALKNAIDGLASGYAALPGTQRRPVAPATFKLYEELKAEKIVRYTKIEGRLPPMKSAAA